MTPLATATTRQELAFNAAHCKTRSVIERCFGVWKSRFRCLDKTGGTLLYSAEKTCQLVVATAVLHNIAISRRLAPIEDPAVLARSATIQPVTAYTLLIHRRALSRGYDIPSSSSSDIPLLHLLTTTGSFQSHQTQLNRFLSA